jgi:predicted RNase H-like nuclease (RuvC/YqgF family)
MHQATTILNLIWDTQKKYLPIKIDELEDKITDLNSELDFLAEQGLGYQYKTYIDESYHLHHEEIDDTASQEYVNLKNQIEELEKELKQLKK